MIQGESLMAFLCMGHSPLEEVLILPREQIVVPGAEQREDCGTLWNAKRIVSGSETTSMRSTPIHSP